MRPFLVGAVFLILITTSAAAQSRWTVSVGPDWHPGWSASLGGRVRAEYDLIRPNNVLGLRFETSGRWSPASSYSYRFSDGSGTWGGTTQSFDIMLGFNASISPLPRARFSPYVTAGVFGMQQWVQSSNYQTGSTGYVKPLRTDSRLAIVGALGLGLRMRLVGRTFQLEYRISNQRGALTFGTRLPF
jgi:hypothetical protein